MHWSRCDSVFSDSHGGRSDINNHLQTKKHKISVEVSSSRLTKLFVVSKSDEPLSLAAKEATLAYHLAFNNVLIVHRNYYQAFFEPKFTLVQAQS